MDKFLSQYSQILYLQFCKRHDVKPASDFVWDLEELNERYLDFKAIRYKDICKEFNTANKDACSTRAFKIRGVYPRLEMARDRCSQLNKIDRVHDISAFEVGKWCEFNPPNLGDVDTDYTGNDERLQALMKTHLQQQKDKDQMFNDRKSTMVDGINLDNSNPNSIQVIDESEITNAEDAINSSDETAVRSHKRPGIPAAAKAALQQKLLDEQSGVTDVTEQSDEPDVVSSGHVDIVNVDE